MILIRLTMLSFHISWTVDKFSRRIIYMCVSEEYLRLEKKKFLLGNQIIDGPAFLQSLFHLNQQLYAIDYTLNLLHF